MNASSGLVISFVNVLMRDGFFIGLFLKVFALKKMIRCCKSELCIGFWPNLPFESWLRVRELGKPAASYPHYSQDIL